MMCRCVELLLLLPVGCFNDEVGAVAVMLRWLLSSLGRQGRCRRSPFLKKERFEPHLVNMKRMPKISLTKTLVNCVSRGQEG